MRTRRLKPDRMWICELRVKYNSYRTRGRVSRDQDRYHQVDDDFRVFLGVR